MPKAKSKVAQSVKDQLLAQGKTIPQWAAENGFNVCSVRAVIYGHNKGNFGNAHKIAVALGIKATLK